MGEDCATGYASRRDLDGLGDRVNKSSERISRTEKAVEILEKDQPMIWDTLKDLRESVTKLRVSFGGIGATLAIIQIIGVGLIMWKLTGK